MVHIEFGTETIVYNVIKASNGETLNVDVIYEELLYLTDTMEEKKKYREALMLLHRNQKWLLDMEVFYVNDDDTLSKGKQYNEVKRMLFDQTTPGEFVDEDEENEGHEE